MEDPVPGEVQDWIIEHQARLQVAFEGARERLLAAAGRRKERHDQKVREVPLQIGQLVYVRDHGVRGRHKIQDVWSSVVHQVVKAPGQGAVYTIAPVGALHQVRTVHRDMLKAVVKPVPLVPPPEAQPPPAWVEADSDSSVGDLYLLVPETPLPSTPVVPSSVGSSGHLLRARLEGWSSSGTAPQPGSSAPAPSHSPRDQPGSSQQAPRRTQRLTAGQHSNVHHLPRSTGQVDGVANELPVLNAQSALFRPWS